MIKAPNAQKLYDDLFRQITRMELHPGMAIPSENDLALQYQISRPTVRKILGRLCDKGMLEKRMGKGTFVCNLEKASLDVPDRSFKIAMESYNIENPYYRSIFNAITSSPFGKNTYIKLTDPADITAGRIPEEVDAVFLSGSLYPEVVYWRLLKQGLPLVHLNRKCLYDGVGYATIDHHSEACRAVSVFLQGGYRRIACIGVDLECTTASTYNRFLGWKDAYRSFDLTAPEELVISHTEIRAGNFVSRLQQAGADAYFILNWWAYSIFQLDYLQTVGKSLEDQVLLIFDDIDTFHPEKPLRHNFVRMPIAQMTLSCIEYLWKKSQNPALKPLQQILPGEMVIRHELIKPKL